MHVHLTKECVSHLMLLHSVFGQWMQWYGPLYFFFAVLGLVTLCPGAEP